MERRQKNRHARVTEQVERLRRLYAQIDEPLPMEIITDLYQYLDAALQTADALDPGRRSTRCAGTPSGIQ